MVQECFSMYRAFVAIASKMAVYNFVLICAVCCLCVVAEELNLSEGSPCSSDGVSGTCVPLQKCASAYVSEIYRSAGYDDDRIAKLPEICSTTDKLPIVCCTDCNTNKQEEHKNSVVGPNGVLLEKKGPKARDKCLEYFQRLPYSCRGKGNVKLEKNLNQEKKCHDFSIAATLSVNEGQPSIENFPHMVLIGYGEEMKDVQWKCSGAIISERFILTTAQCMITTSKQPVSYVRYAIKKRNDTQESWKLLKVKRRIPHPDYKAPHKYNDIALLETEKEIQFQHDCLPICLDVDGVEKNSVYLTGWGTVGMHKPLQDTLKIVQLQAVSEPDCDAEYPLNILLPQGLNYSTMMCYRAHDNGVGSCRGDGGSPIQVINQNCLYTAVGVASFGRGCGISPDVYTRISHYIPWIESIVWPETPTEST